MAYATAEDYKQYGNGNIPAVDLDRELERASDQIDSLTFNRIVGRGMAALTPFQQRNVAKAVCQQADFLFQYGNYLNFPLAGYSAGSISLSFKTVDGPGGVKSTEAVAAMLQATGLTSRRLC